MKKAKYLVITLLALLVVTGCGSGKKLTCTKEESSSGIDMKQTITVNFEKDKVSKVKLSLNSKATNETIKSNWNLFAETLGKQFSSSSKEGIKITTKNDSKNYSYLIELEVDVNKAKKEDLEEYDMEDVLDSTESYDDLKKDFEGEGYSCK